MRTPEGRGGARVPSGGPRVSGVGRFSQRSDALQKTKCSIAECERDASRRGWCGLHYQRWYKHGDPLYEVIRYGQCSISNCERKAKVREMCDKHYRQWRKTQGLVKYPEGRCSVDGCHFVGRLYRGMCSAHLSRLWRNGDLHLVRKKIPSVPSCGHPDRRVHGRGMCGPCYRKWRYHNVAGVAERDRVSKRKWRRENPDQWELAKAERQRRYAHAALLADLGVEASNVATRHRANARARQLLKRTVTGKISANEWRVIIEAFNGRCAYCLIAKPLTQEHMTPISRGGTHTPDNVIPACVNCNSRKHDKTLLEFLAAESACA